MSLIPETLLINKEIGETPLEALERARVENGISAETPMTYAGRLDPMAEGLLLVLIGEECKKKEEYLKLDKEYEVEVLLGVSTDTGDILGLIKGVATTSSQHPDIDFSILIGKRIQKYPPYSSKTVDGRQLHEWAREGVEKKVEHEVEIYSIDLLDSRKIFSEDILKNIEERVKKVKGDFRQEEILKSWKEKMPQGEFEIIKIKVSCGSGAYMRVLAEEIGEKLNIPALAWSIKRTKIGDN